ncbi:MAG: hypothetical protein D8M57_19975 [Candidatus Scalindua sp. AMX11]|nr:MAG: hypothetical protein D8M57_19975 [Candidatus Scalindua sp. AMX11]
MNDLSEYKARLQERIDYKNFSEDVEILAENNIDDNLSLYTVKNKNNVTFQNVPGMAWIGLGKLGFVNGERSRPILLGTSDIDVKIKSGKFSARDNSPGSNLVSSGITVIVESTWDIQLEATRGSETVTKTKSSYIRVI